jgi:hypothetical protein
LKIFSAERLILSPGYLADYWTPCYRLKFVAAKQREAEVVLAVHFEDERG